MSEPGTDDSSNLGTSKLAEPTSVSAVGSTEAAVPKTEEAADHYLRRWLIWNDEKYKWVPYDPSSRKATPPRTDVQNYFYVEARYKNKKAEPVTVLTHFSKPLVYFLRTAVGDVYFHSKPEESMQSFFLRIDDFKLRLEEARAALGSPHDPSVLKKHALSLGCVDVDIHDDKYPSSYLIDLVEHLGALLRLLEEEYRPVAEQLALQVSHGRLAYDLLIFYFRPGQRLYTRNENGVLLALDLTAVNYHLGMNPYFQIKGNGMFWNGTKYSYYKIKKEIEAYEGTLELAQLPWWQMTPEIEEKLKERGRHYVALSGVHYRSYDGRRIIVDRQAYDNRWNGYTRPVDQMIPTLHDNSLALLEDIVYGFDLIRKEWKSYPVDRIGDVIFDENAWEHLVLDVDTKELVQSLTSAIINANTSKKIISDVISGKGGGLMAVLHGPPGSGKTLTAEAVAEVLKRPLYTISSLELSTKPDVLEGKLTPILRLATAWDAVLLIDEADVFLEQRSLHDLERNALVSVALRLFEYHRGVLFLTTNRIQTFDRAFLSRFSIAIKYPELDAPARLAVWKKFLDLTGTVVEGQKSAEDTPNSFVHVDSEGNNKVISHAILHELSLKPFNGRTIKNIVRTAQALALSKRDGLSIEHVMKVVRVQEGFLTEFDQAG